jgi:hypothetical protein
MLISNEIISGVDSRLGIYVAAPATPRPNGVEAHPDTDETEAAQEADVVVTLDVEWVRSTSRSARNQVLAYGLRLDCGGRHVQKIVYPGGPERRRRLTLKRLLGSLFSKAIPTVLTEVPDRVTLLMHYGRGDLAACRDFANLKKQVDALGGCFASSKGAAKLAAAFDDHDEDDGSGGLIPKSRRMVVADPIGGVKTIDLVIRDTSLLVAEEGKRSLDAIGQLVGVPKVALPAGYDKARMDVLLENDRSAFERYLTADLAIPPLYYGRLRKLLRELGLRNVPPTLGACSVGLFRSMLPTQLDATGAPLTMDALFGVETVQRLVYAPGTGRYRRFSTRGVTLERAMFDTFMGAAYHGGRTETFETGPSRPNETLYDIDLKSAYPSAMVSIGLPDYAKAFMTDDPTMFTADTLGVAKIKFRCPTDMRFPVFGVRTGHGLVFPIRGEAVVTAPEIASALHLGVDIEVLRGVIVPWADHGVRPYLKFMAELIVVRERLKQVVIGSDGIERKTDTLESLVVKTIANSLYGKTAQAVRPRNVFDARSGVDKPLPPSPVSCPAFAAYTTGLVRAAIVEMLNGVPAGRRVISVSTDGFLTNAPVEEIDVGGPACQIMAANRRMLTGDPSLLEVKKQVLQVVTARNRAAFTAVGVGGSKKVTAKGSIKLPPGVTDADAFLLGLYLERDGKTAVSREDLIPLRRQWADDGDLVGVARQPKVNLEPDFKRLPIDARMEEIVGGPFAGRKHVAAGSRPHETAADMLEARTLFQGWRAGSGRCLKDMCDWADWQDYFAEVLAARSGGRRHRRSVGGSADTLKRQFLRALVRGEWGVGLSATRYQEVADWLTAAGYKTSLTAVKNAKRGSGGDDIRSAAPLTPHSVAATDATVGLLLVILARYPSFDYRRAFVAGHIDKVEAALGKRRKSA